MIKKLKVKKTSQKGKTRKTSAKKMLESFSGMKDVLPRDGKMWNEMKRAFYSVLERHSFYFTETSILEKRQSFNFYESEFKKKVNDCVFFIGSGGAIVRPEGMIPLLRAYAENHLGHFSSPLKATYFLEVARRGEKNKKLNFHEIGFHILGDGEPFYDVQVISTALDFLKGLKIKDATIRVNANGCRTCRVIYNEKLKKFITSNKSKFRVREYKKFEKNPENIFFDKSESIKTLADNAPTLLDYLCQGCNNHFRAFLELLEDNKIQYEPDPRFLMNVLRWDRVIFEINTPESKKPLFFGGRYNHLSESVGGRQIPAVGIIASAQNIIQYICEKGNKTASREKEKAFFIVMGDMAKKASVGLMSELRSNGVIVEEALGKQSFISQLKSAEKSRASIVIIVGQKEAFEETVIIRNVNSGAQETVPIHNLVEDVKKRLKK